MNNNAILVAKNLRKRFGSREVLCGVSFHVAPREIVGLLGSNGAGKSTAFNIVAGLLRPNGGDVNLFGHSLNGLALYRRAQLGLGYLPQDPTVFRGMTVRDNILTAFEARKGPIRGQASAEADTLLREFHLDHLAMNLGHALSGGERRRVEMARTLALEPKVVLLDEPFAGIDPIAITEIHAFIRSMCQRGIGVLLTDHNVRETLHICDRAYLINEGTILLSGTPKEIVNNDMARKTYLGPNFRL